MDGHLSTRETRTRTWWVIAENADEAERDLLHHLREDSQECHCYYVYSAERQAQGDFRAMGGLGNTRDIFTVTLTVTNQ